MKVTEALPQDGASFRCGHRSHIVWTAPQHGHDGTKAVVMLTPEAFEDAKVWDEGFRKATGRAVCQKHARLAEMYVDETVDE